VDVGQFLLLLLEGLSKLDFVEKIDVQTEVFVLNGRAILKKNRFLQIYFNELTGTTAFACRVSTLFPTQFQVYSPLFSVLNFKTHPVKLSIV
jgi:hypothetical protein